MDQPSRTIRAIRSLIQALATAALVLLFQGQFGGCSCSLPWPAPNPNPSPKPAPAPVAEKLWFVVVEETSQRTPAASVVLNDMAYWQGLRAQGHDWITYDKDSPAAAAKGYAAQAAALPLPALLVLDKGTGRLLKKQTLPASTAAIDVLKRELTGK